MAYEDITLTIEGGLATVTLNRPDALNAISLQMLADLDAALDEITAPDSGVRCLLMTGAGRGFCAGADLAGGGGLQGQGPVDLGHVLERHYNPLIQRLGGLSMPFVTAVNGPAAGAGMSFALAGDIVVAARSAYFLQAFVNIGLVPDAGSTYVLPRLVGRARAQAMMMLGEKIPAETAADWGMIYQVVDDDALLDTARTLATKLANGPTQAYARIRGAMRASLDSSLAEQLHLERVLQRELGATEDFREGVAAFLQKRPAEFTGR